MKSPVWRSVGFDARETELDGRKTPIPVHISKAFLLRPEIELPYSVDGSAKLGQPPGQVYGCQSGLLLALLLRLVDCLAKLRDG